MKLTVCVVAFVVISGCFLLDSLDGSATPNNIREVFIGRCWEYQQVVHTAWVDKTTSKNCTELWNKFEAAFVYRDACGANDSSYNDFLAAAHINLTTLNRVMYWSGPVVPLVNEYTENARRWLTIRDTLPGYILKNVDDWCGKNDSDSGGLGMDFDNCPSWYSCPGFPARMSASQAFWRSTSTYFAQLVQGDVRLLLNASTGQAYRNQSTFAQSELAHLGAPRNPVLHVLLIHDIIPRSNEIRETCQNGTLLQLKAEVEEKGMIFNCTDDPLELLHFQCSDYVGAERCDFRIGTGDQVPVENSAEWSLPSLATLFALSCMSAMSTGAPAVHWTDSANNF